MQDARCKKSDLWGTPRDLILEKGWDSWYDPCPFPPSEINGLDVDWLKYSKIFINPPYSNIKPWAKKCAETIERAKELNQEIEIDLLIPLATPKYYWDFIHGKCTSEFLKKRLKFIDLSGKIKKVGDFRKDCWIHHYSFKPEK